LRISCIDHKLAYLCR